MGVLTDYFRAPARAAVERAMQTDTASPIDRGDSRFDGIALKDVDDKVLLGKLVAAINRTEWSPGITGSVAVYPPAHTRPHPDDGWDSLPEDSPWMTGPWVTELSNETRQTLASLDPDRIPSVAANWIQAEEFRGQMDVATAEQIVGEIRTLALRAEQAGEPLYCWTSL